MKTAFAVLLAVMAAHALPAHAANVRILQEPASVQSAYAARKLGETLVSLGHEVRTGPADDGFLITLRVLPALGAEAFAIARRNQSIAVVGGDARGLIYGALALRDALRQGTALDKIAASDGAPRLAFRGIKFNTPWDTYRPSSALDQHYDTVRDLKYWEAFLDMMVENRFNALSLWTMHPFTYMMQPEEFSRGQPVV